MVPSKIEHKQLVYQNQYQRIYRIVAKFGDFTKEYFVNETGIRVGVVAIQGGKVLLVRQYRLLIDGLSWEIPGGSLNKGETLKEAAVRECLEETGVRCSNLRPLTFFYPGTDVSNNPTHIFFSDSVFKTNESRKVEMSELTHSEWVPLEDCIKMILRHAILDSFTMLGLLTYKSMVLEGKNGINKKT